jgi:hypothetical protein
MCGQRVPRSRLTLCARGSTEALNVKAELSLVAHVVCIIGVFLVHVETLVQHNEDRELPQNCKELNEFVLIDVDPFNVIYEASS